MKKGLLILIGLLLCGCSNKNGINNNSIIDEAGQISVIEKEVYTYDKNYDLESNLLTNQKVTCEPNSLQAGKNIINCKIKDKSVSYILYLRDTKNKNIIFFGDSITSGFGSKTRSYSWPEYIKNNYDFANVVNAGIIDYRVSTYDNPNKWLGTQVKNHFNDGIKYDYVIMQGGINDVFYDTPLGKISKGFHDDFDINTFAGGLEKYLELVKKNWPDSKIGYIITYFTPEYVENDRQWDYEIYQKYYDLQIAILEKWKIPYLDLHKDQIYGAESTQTLSYEGLLQEFLPDNLHLNDEGYNIISPYIYNWLSIL